MCFMEFDVILFHNYFLLCKDTGEREPEIIELVLIIISSTCRNKQK